MRNTIYMEIGLHLGARGKNDFRSWSDDDIMRLFFVLVHSDCRMVPKPKGLFLRLLILLFYSSSPFSSCSCCCASFSPPPPVAHVIWPDMKQELQPWYRPVIILLGGPRQSPPPPPWDVNTVVCSALTAKVPCLPPRAQASYISYIRRPSLGCP